jgi:tetratricopeptide (TPR) repeat protein
MKKIITCLLFICIAFISHAQDKYVDSLKTVLAKTSKPIERFDLLNKILEYGYINGESNPDSSSCIEVLSIAEQLNNDSLLAIGYNQVGNYFLRSNGDFSSALEYFFKGIPLAEKVHDKRRLSSLYIDIAALYSKLNNAEEELKYTRKALANLPEKTSPLYNFMAAQAQYYMCSYFLSQQKKDSALHYAQALNETNLSLKSPIFEAAIHGLMGVVYDRMGDKFLAELHMSRANSLYDSIHYLFAKLEGKGGYIDYLLKNHKVAEAKQQALLLMGIGLQKNIYDVKRVAAGFLITIYDNNHQPDSAFYYSRLESVMRDSLFSQNNINKIQALAFNEKIRVMEEADRLADEARQRNRNIQFELLAFGIITFIILFLLLSRSFITNTKVIEFLGVISLLIVFEFLNLLLHPFLERITHHSPVLMLLALVCIAALLVPLHHRLQKWATHRLVEKNKQIRLAAAKKTIRLLSDE